MLDVDELIVTELSAVASEYRKSIFTMKFPSGARLTFAVPPAPGTPLGLQLAGSLHLPPLGPM
jgi:hypothetical protein